MRYVNELFKIAKEQGVIIDFPCSQISINKVEDSATCKIGPHKTNFIFSMGVWNSCDEFIEPINGIFQKTADATPHKEGLAESILDYLELIGGAYPN